MDQFITSKFMKKVVLSVSLFSFFFSYSSSWHSFFLNSFTTQKNCIFLICNGILMFLAKSSSGFIRYSPENDLNDEFFTRIGSNGLGFHSAVETNNPLVVEEDDEKNSAVETNDSLVKRKEKEEETNDSLGEEEEESIDSLVERGEEEEEEEAAAANDMLVERREEKDDDELGTIGLRIERGGRGRARGRNEMVISREELNKKCDEFIRRMKEEMRIGAQNNYSFMAN